MALPFDRLRRSPALWLIVAVVILLNLWYDYCHPLGIFFDIVIVIVLIAKGAGSE